MALVLRRCLAVMAVTTAALVFHVKQWARSGVDTMPFITVPGTAQFRMQYLWRGQECENVFHVRTNGEWSETKLNEVAGTFAGWFTQVYAPLTPPDVVLQRVVSRDLSTGEGNGTEYTQDLPAPGRGPNNSLPNNATLAVKWGTGRPGRSFRGRTYIVGVCSGFVGADGSVGAGYQNSIRQAWDQLRTALDNVTLAVEFVVVSRFHNKAPRVPPITTPISGVSVEPFLDSQRRRLPGRGV